MSGSAMRIIWATILVATLAGPARAADPPATEPPQTLPLTAKERLSGKAADGQRVNDCKVPKEARGASTRPDDCGHIKAPAETGGQ